MTTTFDCPRCGAPLDPPESAAATMECPYCDATVIVPEALRVLAPPAPPLPPLDEVKRLIEAGKKIEAIKLVRSLTQLDLKAAAQAVEALERGEPLRLVTAPVQPAIISIDLSGSPEQPALPGGLEAELRALLQQNQRAAAIHLLRERLDLSMSAADTTLALLATGLPLLEALHRAGWRLKDQLKAQARPVELPSASRKAVAATTVGGCSFFLIFIIFFAVIVPLAAVGAALFMPDGPFGEAGARLNPLAYARLEQAFGEEGEGQGYLEDLRLLALAPDGSVYTAEYETGRIQHFNSEGEFLNLWFVPGTDYMDEVYLEDLKIGPDGLVYAVARGEIFIYEGPTGILLQNFQPEIEGRRQSVDILAFSPDGTPYALVDGETLLRFDASWQPELLGEDIVSAVTKDSESSPSLAFDGRGGIYLLGGSNQSIFRYDRNGAYLNRFGSQGEEKGQFTYAQDLAVDRYGRMVVSDSAGILLFDADGRFLREFGIPGVAFDMQIDAQNRLWLATTNRRVLAYALPAP